VSNPKHTPGPWSIQTSNSYRRIGNNMGDGNVLSPCNQPDGHPDLYFQNGGFNGPDARLIAAAPDLLEALQVVLRDHMAVHGVGDLEMQPALFQARAAIAKATGGAK